MIKDFAKNKSGINKIKCFIILDIELNGFSDRIRFFRDPNFIEGIYTLENIPPYVIEPIEKFII